MLRSLHVTNVAVVASAAVELGEGLNALTGETGAGKSLVVDSLALLAGARASSDLIRSEADSLTVTGVFDEPPASCRTLLRDAGLPEDADELIVRREVSRKGRNRVLINDHPATLRLLTDLAPSLLRIHGQREELGLVAPDLQRGWLDTAGGAEAGKLLAEVADAWQGYREVAARLERIEGDERARRERLDLLRFQQREIDSADLTAGEESELTEQRDLLRHQEAIVAALSGTLELLVDDEEAASARVARAARRLAEIERWDPRAAAWGEEAHAVRIRLDELAHEVRDRLDTVESAPGELDAVETRLATLERLTKKYALDTTGLLALREEIGEELADLEGDQAHRGELEEAVASALAAYRNKALALSAARAGWGKALARRIEGELADLGLGKAKLEVALERRRRADSPLEVDGEPVEMGPEGIDHVVFLFAPNPGESPRPLARIASGGELSRVYLALLLVAEGGTGGTDEAPATLVFDEVDTGIGGAEAAALGKKLQRLAEGGQIVAVTHLPQVSSFADLHFKITKGSDGGRTRTVVESLDGAARVEEIARMLAGSEVTDLSRSHADELLQAGRRTAGG